MKWEAVLLNRYIQIVERCNHQIFVTAHNVERRGGIRQVSIGEKKHHCMTGGKGFPVDSFIEFIQANGYEEWSTERNLSGDVMRQWRRR
jgi:hypothetical protein